MSAFSLGHLARRQVEKGRQEGNAIGAYLSRLDADDRVFTAVVIVVGFLPCMLLMFALFAKWPSH